MLLAINDTSIQDVFDYRYLIKNEYIEVLVEKQDGEEWLLEIDKDYDEDLGIGIREWSYERIPHLQQQVHFLLY